MTKEKPVATDDRHSQNCEFVGDEIYKDGTKIPRLIQAPNNPSPSPILPSSFIRTGPGSWKHISAVLDRIVGRLNGGDQGQPS